MEEQWLSRRKTKLELNEIEMFLSSILDELKDPGRMDLDPPTAKSRCQNISIFSLSKQGVKKSDFGVYGESNMSEPKQVAHVVSVAMLKGLEGNCRISEDVETSDIVIAAVDAAVHRNALQNGSVIVNVGVKHVEQHQGKAGFEWLSEKTSSATSAVKKMTKILRRTSLGGKEDKDILTSLPTRSLINGVNQKAAIPIIESMVSEKTVLDFSFNSLSAGLESDMSNHKETRNSTQEVIRDMEDRHALSEVGRVLSPVTLVKEKNVE